MFPACNKDSTCFAYRIRNAEINAFTISIDKLCTGLSASLKAVSKTLSSDKFGELKDYFKVYLNQLCKRIYHIRRQATISIIHSFLTPELKYQNYGENLFVETGDRTYKMGFFPIRRLRD
jgi:hypothetical protein